MTQDHGTIREIVWHDLCPWLILARTFRIAIGARILLLAAAALVTVTAGRALIGQAFRGTDDGNVQRWIQIDQTWPWQFDGQPLVSLRGSDALPGWIPEPLRWLGVTGPIPHVWQRLSDPFVRLFRMDLSGVELAYLLLCCLWTTAAWALFAGGITRIAALALARDETLGPKAALTHAGKKWRDYVSAPLLPLLGLCLATVFLLIPGWFMRLDFFVLVAGIFWPIVLLIGLFLAIVLLGLFAGWPLLWPAISVEQSDAFDAISNGYAYVYQRPLRYLFYGVIAAVVGLLGALVVNVFVGAVLYLSAWAVSWGSGTERIGAVLAPVAGSGSGWLLAIGTALITFWTDCLRLVQPAFYHGFFWTAATAIYLLLRRDVDAKEMDEVVVDGKDPLGGLPPLTDEQAATPPAPAEPAAEKPASDQPAAEKPANDEPAAEKPASDEPTNGSSAKDTATGGD